MSSATPVYISADFLMTKESEQFNNRRWFKDLLHRPLTLATGQAPIAFTSSLTDNSKLNRKKFFELSGIELIDSLQFWFDDKKVTQASIDYLNKFLPQGSVLVGYEFGEATRRVLTRAKVQFIDIWLHPVRFYEDVLFGISSNNKAVFEGMKPFHVADELFWLYADRLKIQLYKGFRRDEEELVPNSALLVGQTLEDKAICRDGKMLSLLDFKDKVEALSKEYARVYFSRHPFVKKGDEETLKWLQSLPNVELTSVPSYHLIANQNIKKVVAISSSVVHEARFFGKKTEFFFKPIFTFGQRFEKDYLTVYHDFLSPHFWAAALGALVPVKENAPKLVFTDGKDKLRDMLAFYWGWPNIDKTEAMRQKLNAVAARVHDMGKATPAVAAAPAVPSVLADVPLPELDQGLTGQALLAKAKKVFASAKVVTFDVFDTVVERPFENYETLFSLIAPEVQALTGIPQDKFIELRRRSRALAESRRTNEEVSLPVRYAAMLEAAGVPLEHAPVLASYEFEMDLQVLRPRPIGVQLVELARSMGKKVVFVSDIYYSTEQVAAMLERCGIKGYDRLFTSCDEGKLKHSGTLFPHVFEVLKVKPEHVVHIGDNEHSDVKMAKQSGATARWLPQAAATFKERSLSSASLTFKDAATQSVIRGLVAKAFHDVPGSGLHPTWCDGDANRFGYGIAGPVFFGFAHWVLQQAKAQGLKKLYFLARDGDIVKRVYDQLAANDKDAPKSVYLLASRRSVNVASIKTLEEALALLKVNFSPCPVGHLLKARFGLEATQVTTAALEAGGYQTTNDKADFKLHQEKLAALVTALWPVIDANCREERTALLEYYRAEGLFDDEDYAVVDIGHNGTMQISLARLTGKKPLGYYFVTYSAIADLAKHGLEGFGYAGEKLSGKASEHPYCQFLLMFEMLFLNNQGSFVKLVKKNGGLYPVYLSTQGEESRIEFIQKVHAGVVQFARDVATCGVGLERMKVTGTEAIASYIAMLRSPSLPDAQMMDGVAFENVYSGRDVRYILAPAGSKAESLWKEGRMVLDKHAAFQGPFVSPWLDWVVKKYCSDVKWLKYKSNPAKFFTDSKKASVRWLGRRLVPA